MTDNETENVPARTTPVTVGPEQGGNLMAAWRGVYHLFGGRAEFDVTPDGIIARDFSVDGHYDPDAIISDVSGRNRRVSLAEGYPILQGQEPAEFTDSLDLTKWMQQYFRKPGEDGKSPQYVKDAIAAYKKDHGFPPRKGRAKKVIKIVELGSLNENQLAGVKVTELERLAATVAAAIESQRSAQA